MIFHDFHMFHLEESASHPHPSARGSAPSGAKHSPPGDRGPPDCLEGVPPVCVPGPPLIYHISAPCQPNEEFSTFTFVIFDDISDGIDGVHRTYQEPLRSRQDMPESWKIVKK